MTFTIPTFEEKCAFIIIQELMSNSNETPNTGSISNQFYRSLSFSFLLINDIKITEKNSIIQIFWSFWSLLSKIQMIKLALKSINLRNSKLFHFFHIFHWFQIILDTLSVTNVEMKSGWLRKRIVKFCYFSPQLSYDF